MKNEQLILLFEMKNIDIIQLENELSKNELLGQIVDNGVINENSVIDYLDIDSMIQLYSYTVNYEGKKYLFYEKVHVITDEKGKNKHGKYKSIEIYEVKSLS